MLIKKTAAVFLFLCLCSSFGNAESRESITIRVANFAPNYFKNNGGGWTGVSVELAGAIVRRAGFEPNFVDLPWSRAMFHLETGDLQYMTNLYKTEARSKFLYWIGPVRKEKMGLIVHRENKSLPITSLDDLQAVCKAQQMNFGIQQDISYSDAFNRRMKVDPGFRACFDRAVADVELNLRKTVNRRILGFFESVPTMMYRLQTDPKYADLVVHSFVLKTDEVYHGVSMRGVSPAKLKKFQDAHARCAADGTIQRILTKWNTQ